MNDDTREGEESPSPNIKATKARGSDASLRTMSRAELTAFVRQAATQSASAGLEAAFDLRVIDSLAALPPTAQYLATVAIKEAVRPVNLVALRKAVAAAVHERRKSTQLTANGITLTAGDWRGIVSHFCNERFAHPDGFRILHADGGFLVYENHCWRRATRDEIRSQLAEWLDGTQVDSNGNITPFRPDKHDIDNAIDALASLHFLRVLVLPCWREHASQTTTPPSIIGFENGLLDLETFRSIDSVILSPPTPRWLSLHCLPFAFDRSATCPQWLAFLAQVAAGDTTWVTALQQWIGYCLSTDTSQQKMALFVGPKRAGKGTILRIVRQLIGEPNVASPSLRDLATDFGREPLLDKLVALVSDAHLPRYGGEEIVEFLKRISGEDGITVNRKYEKHVTTKLTARLIIVCNQLANLHDSSGALAGRFLVWPFKKCFLGAENPRLTKQLETELPGIANWALSGLAAYRHTGNLAQCTSGAEAMQDLVRLTSPVLAFVDDACALGPNRSIPCSQLFTLWSSWCEGENQPAGTQATFGSMLQAAIPTIHKSRPGPRGARTWIYHGIEARSKNI